MTVSDMKKHLKGLSDGRPPSSSKLARPLPLLAINARAVAKHKYSLASNRHEPIVKLMHGPREGYDRYLRGLKCIPRKGRRHEDIWGEGEKKNQRPSEGINVLALDLGEAFTVDTCARREGHRIFDSPVREGKVTGSSTQYGY
ncbi:hypothetical protein BGX26_003650 [Mortierella sp. AD094]|nr:hypothetical protein BGX26_003650 [Mortierella sp. AD094]